MTRDEALPIAKKSYEEMKLALQSTKDVIDKDKISLDLLRFIQVDTHFFHVDELKD